MCTNYRPTSRELIDDYFDTSAPDIEFREEAYPGYQAPIIRLAHEDEQKSKRKECIAATFGLIPPWSKDGKNYRSAYNARTETVFEKPTFRNAWRKRQYCIVPMDWFYEPNYETGRPIRWRIERQDQKPFGVAAIYDYWKNPQGQWIALFSLLTVNADRHPIMGQFHPVNDEKRSVVVIAPESYDDWLHATTDEVMTFLAPIPSTQFTSAPAPK